MHDDQHPLLRFRQQNLIRRHSLLSLRNPIQFDFDSRPAPTRGLTRRTGQPRRAHILHSNHQIRPRIQLQTRFKQQLPHKRISHLHRRPIRLALLRQIPRGKRRPRQSIPPSLRPDIKNRIPHSLRRPTPNLIVPQRPQTKHIHQRISLIRGIKHQLPTHRGYPHTVPIVRNPSHHSMNQRPRPFSSLPLRLRPSKSQRIHKRHRPRPHRENIPQDSSYSRRRSLEWLHRAWMVVRLDLIRQCQSISCIHHSGIFLSSLD